MVKFLFGILVGVVLADLTYPTSDERLWLAGKPPAETIPADCITDTECMSLCLPDEDDCDGGPDGVHNDL